MPEAMHFMTKCVAFCFWPRNAEFEQGETCATG
jgi:hypothetical protein